METSKRVKIGQDGVAPPAITICAAVPFKNLSWNNVTYEAYDANTLEQHEIILEFGSLQNGELHGEDPEAAKIQTIYTRVLGRCYIVNFMKKVQ